MPIITVILHNIRSTHNVGAILRTAEGFGVNRCIFTGYTPYPIIPNDTRLPHIANKTDAAIHKTALGAEKMLPLTVHDDIHQCLEQLQSDGYTIIGLEQDDRSIMLDSYTPPDKVSLILGEEVAGIQPTLRKQCDVLLEIPMTGRKESFNVSVATGIALYQLSRPS